MTAAVAERSMEKKNVAEKRVTEDAQAKLQKLPPKKQSAVYDEIFEKYLKSGSGVAFRNKHLI